MRLYRHAYAFSFLAIAGCLAIAAGATVSAVARLATDRVEKSVIDAAPLPGPSAIWVELKG